MNKINNKTNTASDSHILASQSYVRLGQNINDVNNKDNTANDSHILHVRVTLGQVRLSQDMNKVNNKTNTTRDSHILHVRVRHKLGGHVHKGWIAEDVAQVWPTGTPQTTQTAQTKRQTTGTPCVAIDITLVTHLKY